MDKIFVWVFICGILSILFQGIGLWSPAWLIYDMKVHTADNQFFENAELGLFTGHACAGNLYSRTQCFTFTMNMRSQLSSQSGQPEAIKTAAAGHFLLLQILTVVGGLGTIVALFLSFRYCRLDSNVSSQKSLGIGGACLYILSAMLLLGAVAYKANQYTTSKLDLDTLSKMEEVIEKLQMSVHFPWAVAMTGVGALFSTVNGLIVSLRLCYADKLDAGGPNSQTKLFRT